MSENLTLEKKNMYICPKCGMENDPDARFCSQCGKTMKKPTHRVCSRCRVAYPTEEQFCKKCGSKLKERYRIPKQLPRLSPWINKGIVLAVAFALILCIFLPCFHYAGSNSSYDLSINSIELVLKANEGHEGLRTVANVLIAYFVYVALFVAFTVYQTLKKESNGLVYKIISWLTLVASPVLLLVVYMKGMDDLYKNWSRVGIYNGIMVAIILLCFINIFASLIFKLIKKLSIQYPTK